MADLLKPILDNGIQSTNFFNGRLLMAEDLQTEQTAHRQQHQELGRAIGDGVVYGLVVQSVVSSPAPPQPTVSVSAGLAITRSGRAILLPTDQQLALIAGSVSSVPGLDSCGRNTLFVECATSPTSTLNNPGLYVLTAMPASGLSSALAPMAEVGSGGVGTSCGSKYSIEGVQFRLVTVNLTGQPGSLRDQLATSARQTSLSGGALYKLRNGLAHTCYGTELLPSFAAAPFNVIQGQSPFAAFGLLDDLRAQKLISDCEVPLALLYWTTAGIRFVDAWSVRRRCARRLLDDLWPLMIDDRRVGDAEAGFLQFQDQIAAMQVSESNLPQRRAVDYFYYLPAGGFLPTAANQFTAASFFSGFTVNNMTTEPAMLPLLMDQSRYMDPIDFNSKTTLRLYSVDGASGYLFFTRRPNWKRVIPTTEERGAITVEILLQDAAAGAASSKPESVQIIAQSATVKPRRIYATFDGSTHNPQGQKFTYTYDLGNLPLDKYRIEVIAKGYGRGGPQDVTVDTTTRKVVLFTLARKSSPSRQRPPASKPATWASPGWYGKVYMVDQEYTPTWPPRNAGNIKWQDVGDPPPDIQQWLNDWSNYAAGRNPAAAGVTTVRMVRDPAHTPAQTYDQPYAYAVFGANGGAMPILLTGKDQTLDHSTTTIRAAVPGVDPAQDAARLQAYNLQNVDALGAAWKSLVSKALDIGHSTAGTIISGAQTVAASLAGTVLMFSGVDTNVAAALAKQNITTAADLANADPAKLAAGDISQAQAERMVDEARKVVPREAWSLDSPAVGLSQKARTALQKNGITTLGAFNAAATSEITKAGVATMLNVSTDQLAKAAQSALTQKNAAAMAHRVGAPATSVFGVGSSTAVKLANAGLGTAGELAKADPPAIAKFFGNDLQKATDVVAAAKSFLG